jgi:hypothetical protein
LYIQNLLHQFPTDYPDDSKSNKERAVLDEAMADMPRVVGKVDPNEYNSLKRVTKAQISTIIDPAQLDAPIGCRFCVVSA